MGILERLPFRSRGKDQQSIRAYTDAHINESERDEDPYFDAKLEDFLRAGRGTIIEISGEVPMSDNIPKKPHFDSDAIILYDDDPIIDDGSTSQTDDQT